MHDYKEFKRIAGLYPRKRPSEAGRDALKRCWDVVEAMLPFCEEMGVEYRTRDRTEDEQPGIDVVFLHLPRADNVWNDANTVSASFEVDGESIESSCRFLDGTVVKQSQPAKNTYAWFFEKALSEVLEDAASRGAVRKGIVDRLNNGSTG